MDITTHLVQTWQRCQKAHPPTAYSCAPEWTATPAPPTGRPSPCAPIQIQHQCGFDGISFGPAQSKGLLVDPVLHVAEAPLRKVGLQDVSIAMIIRRMTYFRLAGPEEAVGRFANVGNSGTTLHKIHVELKQDEVSAWLSDNTRKPYLNKVIILHYLATDGVERPEGCQIGNEDAGASSTRRHDDLMFETLREAGTVQTCEEEVAVELEVKANDMFLLHLAYQHTHLLHVCLEEGVAILDSVEIGRMPGKLHRVLELAEKKAR